VNTEQFTRAAARAGGQIPPRGTSFHSITIQTRVGGGWPILPRGTSFHPSTIRTRAGAEPFLSLVQKRFVF
jgi:hypothetical protein